MKTMRFLFMKQERQRKNMRYDYYKQSKRLDKDRFRQNCYRNQRERNPLHPLNETKGRKQKSIEWSLSQQCS